MNMDYIEKAVAAFERFDSPGLVESKPTADSEFQYTQSKVVSLSSNHLRQNHILTPEMDRPIVTAYNVLRTRVLQRMQQNVWTALAVTSPMPDEGKTLTAINLSISLARKLDYTVLLVDLDFRNPSIHKRFGFEPQHGLSEYLSGDVRLEEVFINPGIKRLVILPERTIERDSSEILSSVKMQQLVRELKNRYPSRIIIFDLPPVLVGDDVLAFSSLADAVLLVTREGKTTTNELSRAVQLLEKTNLLGTVLNRSAAENDYSNYGY